MVAKQGHAMFNSQLAKLTGDHRKDCLPNKKTKIAFSLNARLSAATVSG